MVLPFLPPTYPGRQRPEVRPGGAPQATVALLCPPLGFHRPLMERGGLESWGLRQHIIDTDVSKKQTGKWPGLAGCGWETRAGGGGWLTWMPQRSSGRGGHVTGAPSGLGRGRLCGHRKGPRQAGPPTLGPQSCLALKARPAVPRTAVRLQGREPSLPWAGSPGSPGTGASLPSL